MVSKEDALRFQEEPPEDRTLVLLIGTPCRIRPHDVINRSFAVTAVVEEGEDGEDEPGSITLYLVTPDGSILSTTIPPELAHSAFVEIYRYATDEEIESYESGGE